mgnify:CR=1 FL=1
MEVFLIRRGKLDIERNGILFYGPLMEMLEAAKEDNWDQLPLVVSGYRTQEKQQRLYDDKIAKYRGQGYSESEAKEMAEQWVAVRDSICLPALNTNPYPLLRKRGPVGLLTEHRPQ